MTSWSSPNGCVLGVILFNNQTGFSIWIFPDRMFYDKSNPELVVAWVIAAWLPLKEKRHIPPARYRWKNVPLATAVTLAYWSNLGSNTLLTLRTDLVCKWRSLSLYGEQNKFHQFLWVISSPYDHCLLPFVQAHGYTGILYFHYVLDRYT